MSPLPRPRVRHDRAAPADDLALILGDLLTNLRGALDYLVWELVFEDHGVPTE
jgi:hypothetical protein